MAKDHYYDASSGYMKPLSEHPGMNKCGACEQTLRDGECTNPTCPENEHNVYDILFHDRRS
jgi:hypothetical protein